MKREEEPCSCDESTNVHFTQIDFLRKAETIEENIGICDFSVLSNASRMQQYVA